MQRKYDKVTDFSADFVHSYRGGVLKQQATERGTLLVKKPGKMRWEYTAPEKKLFVSDGHKIYSYIPQDKQVHRRHDAARRARADAGAVPDRQR